ncbi:MAG: hypothetical protein NZ850_04360 [Caldimicrobium sp.]|nr:hypothetical protein [Caldimicrobium sp.]
MSKFFFKGLKNLSDDFSILRKRGEFKEFLVFEAKRAIRKASLESDLGICQEDFMRMMAG